MPAEMITGQNLYDPEFKGKNFEKAGKFQEDFTQFGSKVLPVAAGMLGGPAAGMAESGIQAGAGTMGDGDSGWDPTNRAAQLGNAGASLAPIAGAMGGGAGMPATGNSGFGATPGGFGQGMNQGFQLGTAPMMAAYGGDLPENQQGAERQGEVMSRDMERKTRR